MDDTLNVLVDKIWTKFLATPPDRRFLIGIAGIPGSGKTTLSQRLTAALNTRHAASSQGAAANPAPPPIAVFVPMDGFHLTRAQLERMPDPALAHARRGAEWTFDGAGFARLVERLAEPATPLPRVLAPSFDHAVKDPREDDIAVEGHHRIVVLEGNYLLLSTPPWSTTIPHYSHRIFVRCPAPVARARLAARHLAAGIVQTAEEADRRAVDNDLPNGDQVLRLLREEDVDDFVDSVEDGAWGAAAADS